MLTQTSKLPADTYWTSVQPGVQTACTSLDTQLVQQHRQTLLMLYDK